MSRTPLEPRAGGDEVDVHPRAVTMQVSVQRHSSSSQPPPPPPQQAAASSSSTSRSASQSTAQAVVVTRHVPRGRVAAQLPVATVMEDERRSEYQHQQYSSAGAGAGGARGDDDEETPALVSLYRELELHPQHRGPPADVSVKQVRRGGAVMLHHEQRGAYQHAEGRVASSSSSSGHAQRRTGGAASTSARRGRGSKEAVGVGASRAALVSRQYVVYNTVHASLMDSCTHQFIYWFDDEQGHDWR